jgi:GlcNAc-PI de-N-acetylase
LKKSWASPPGSLDTSKAIDYNYCLPTTKALTNNPWRVSPRDSSHSTTAKYPIDNHIIFVIMGLLIFSWLSVFFLALWQALSHLIYVNFPPLQGKRICILIAHPDDEAMFFSPTVVALTDPALKNHVRILCLCSGMSPIIFFRNIFDHHRTYYEV